MSPVNSVLVAGVGSIGERHLRCFRRTGRAQLALCEVDAALRREVAERYGIDRVHADLDEALSGGYDAAVICTPAHLHVPMASRAAEAGMHLLVEKPLSTGLEGIGRLQRIVDDRRLVVMVAYVMRNHPSLRAMKTAVDTGRFGPPVQMIGVAGQHFPTYRPDYRHIYYRDRATGGGAVQDALTHLVNAAEWLAGPVDRLVADTAHRVLEGVEVEDTVGVLARHGDVLGTYALNQHQAPNELSLTVVCQRGTVRWELHRGRWRWMARPDEPWHNEPVHGLQRDDLFTAQANAFLDAVEGQGEPPCSLQDALQTLRCNLAMLASAETGTWQCVT